MHSDLMDVPAAIELSKKTIYNIKQNLFWAFGYNTIGINKVNDKEGIAD